MNDAAAPQLLIRGLTSVSPHQAAWLHQHQRVSGSGRFRGRRWRKGKWEMRRWKRSYMKDLVCVRVRVCACVRVTHSKTSSHKLTTVQIFLSAPPPTSPGINNWLFFDTGPTAWGILLFTLQRRDVLLSFFCPSSPLFHPLSFSRRRLCRKLWFFFSLFLFFLKEWALIYYWGAVSSSYLYLVGC